MNMKKIIIGLLFLPSVCFADRLGSLRSNADVLLTTQAVTNYIQNTETLQAGATFYVSSGSLTSLYIIDGGSITSNSILGDGMFFSNPNFGAGRWRFNNFDTGVGLQYVELQPALLTFSGRFAGSGSGSYIIKSANGSDMGIMTFTTNTGIARNFSFDPNGNSNPTFTIAADKTTNLYGFFTSTLSATAFNASATSATVTGSGGLSVTYGVTVGSMTGASLSTCGDSTHGLSWTGGQFGCQSITGSGGGGGSGSPIAITTGSIVTYANPAISTPMLVGVYDQGQFGILATGTTAFITIAYSTVSITATYTAFSTNTIILADATSGSFTVTLSTMNSNGSSIQIGKVYTVSRTNSGVNTVTVAGATGTIIGDATQVLSSQWATIDVFWQGMNWGIK